MNTDDVENGRGSGSIFSFPTRPDRILSRPMALDATSVSSDGPVENSFHCEFKGGTSNRNECRF